MFFNKWLFGIVGTFLMIIGLGTWLLYLEKAADYANSNSENQASWESLVRTSLESPHFKVRRPMPAKQSRGIASAKEERLIKKGNATFSVEEGQYTNIKKGQAGPTAKRLIVKNINTGKSAFLSGELIISTQSIESLPTSAKGMSFTVLKTLDKNKYLVLITPESEVLAGLDLLKEQIKIEAAELDVVDREFLPK